MDVVVELVAVDEGGRSSGDRPYDLWMMIDPPPSVWVFVS